MSAESSAGTTKRKAVFLDRDGVINRVFMRDGKPRAPSLVEDFEFYPGVPEAIEQLRNAGFLLVVVTNQPDVARGWQKLEVVEQMNQIVLDRLGVHDIRVCYHVNEDGCLCRKPSPGMLVSAAEEWSIDLSGSFMVGDRYSDIVAGRGAGCRTVLVGEGDAEEAVTPDYQVESLLAAAAVIVEALGENSRLASGDSVSIDSSRTY